VRAASLMMEAARTSETPVDIQLRTQQYIPEDSELQVILTSRYLLTDETTICSFCISRILSVKMF
jgi:hypothetical protein